MVKPKVAKVPNGSSTSRVLEELEQSDFIMAYHPFKKKKKDKIYWLIDEYSLFYLKFIEGSTYEGAGTFMQLSGQQIFKIWCGYAFEGICMKHVPQIKKALGIGGVYTTTYSYLRTATKDEKGIQIDMLIERADRVINSISEALQPLNNLVPKALLTHTLFTGTQNFYEQQNHLHQYLSSSSACPFRRIPGEVRVF